MVAPAAVVGASQAAGSALTNYTNYRLAKRQEQFQERMSNTAYQRGVSDMRKAGLNPALAYQQGGASVPPGAKAEMEDMVSPAVNSAVSVRRANAELANLHQQNKLLQAQTRSTDVKSAKDAATAPIYEGVGKLTRSFGNAWSEDMSKLRKISDKTSWGSRWDMPAWSGKIGRLINEANRKLRNKKGIK